jgi:hypothetical protein
VTECAKNGPFGGSNVVSSESTIGFYFCVHDVRAQFTLVRNFRSVLIHLALKKLFVHCHIGTRSFLNLFWEMYKWCRRLIDVSSNG